MQIFSLGRALSSDARQSRARRRGQAPRARLLVEALEERLVLDAHAHLLFAPGTPQSYIDQFQLDDGTGGIAQFQFSDSSRWSSTTQSGGGLGQGDPTIITWSIVPDGTNINGFIGEGASPSNFVSTFRNVYNVNETDNDYVNEAWFTPIQQSFDRWSELTGITYVYEPNDDGANFGYFGGISGVRGDVRIGGHTLDGNSGTLAYNFFPNTSDMVIDTADSFYNFTGGNSIRLRNVVMHEAGHGIGVSHVESNNAGFLMEPFISTSFDGPQLDDILAAHRGYGDANEGNGGNNTSGTATGLGLIGDGQTRQVGLDAVNTFVAAADTDFVSIDDNSDVDYYSFSVAAGAEIDVTLTPRGPTYNEGPQGGSQSPFNTSAQSNLTLQVIGANGITVLATANNTGLGGSEVLNDVALPQAGTYFLRVSGANNAAQLYELSATVSETAPPAAGVTVTQSGGSTNVSEDGATDTYTLVLDSAPSADVVITINSDEEVSTNFSSVTFTTANWNVARTVTVSAVDDGDVEGSHNGTITHSVSSSDADYDGISVAGVSANVTDNDAAGVTVTQSGGSTNVSEDGQTDTYTLVLNATPTADVTITINPDNELSTNVSSVIFTAANWNVAQSVTVSAVDDVDVEGNHNGTITHSVSSADALYNGISVANVTAAVTDNDVAAGVTVTQSGGSTNVSEDGATDTYDLVLEAMPLADVTITISPDGELSTDPTSVVFTTANWNVAQTVTVSAIDDGDVEGNHVGAIAHSVVSLDPRYGGIAVNGVTANVTDNDEPEPPEPQTLYFSLQSTATANGLTMQDEDIIAFDGASFTMVFDGSDVGLAGVRIDAFDVINDTDVLLSFDQPIGNVDDSDVILFRGTLGANTSGSFFWYIDGSDVGLTGAGEDIDAIALLDDGSILLSTSGSAAGAGLSGIQDEDVFRFVPTSLGSFTSGTFEEFFDGSDANKGLSQSSGEDVNGLAVAGGKLYLTTTGNFSVPGVFGADDDVFVYDVGAGLYDSNLFVNFTSNDLYGLDFAGTASSSGLGFPGGLRTSEIPFVTDGPAPFFGEVGTPRGAPNVAAPAPASSVFFIASPTAIQALSSVGATASATPVAARARQLASTSPIETPSTQSVSRTFAPSTFIYSSIDSANDVPADATENLEGERSVPMDEDIPGAKENQPSERLESSERGEEGSGAMAGGLWESGTNALFIEQGIRSDSTDGVLENRSDDTPAMLAMMALLAPMVGSRRMDSQAKEMRERRRRDW